MLYVNHVLVRAMGVNRSRWSVGVPRIQPVYGEHGVESSPGPLKFKILYRRWKMSKILVIQHPAAVLLTKGSRLSQSLRRAFFVEKGFINDKS